MAKQNKMPDMREWRKKRYAQFNEKIDALKDHPKYEWLRKFANDAMVWNEGYGFLMIKGEDFIDRIETMEVDFIRDWLDGKNELKRDEYDTWLSTRESDTAELINEPEALDVHTYSSHIFMRLKLDGEVYEVTCHFDKNDCLDEFHTTADGTDKREAVIAAFKHLYWGDFEQEDIGTMSFDDFKKSVREKGGIWESSNVYFTEFADGFGASYKPDFPEHSKEDCAISYNFVKDEWKYKSPEQYDMEYYGIKLGVTGEGKKQGLQEMVNEAEKQAKFSFKPGNDIKAHDLPDDR